MPKAAEYRLSWSSEQEVYELREHRSQRLLTVTPGDRAWFAWLDSVPSFTFQGQHGQLTVRKESRQRGDRYWYAYRRVGEKMVKKYLGRTTDLTLAWLEEIAAFLTAAEAPPRREASAHPPSDERVQDRLHPWATVDAAVVGADATPVPPARSSVHRDPLLSTKLHVPRSRVQLVARSHLVERLQEGVAGAVTLVSAPAGFGKTTVLAQWIAQRDLPVAWLSLEAEDNDPTRFLSYLIAALQTLDAQIGTTALALLHTPQPPSPETVLTVLTNELLSRDAGEFALVLDDYHVITADPIQRGMTFLLEHLPPQLHLVLVTRSDPPLPLTRLRAQGQLTEVRAADLRFGAAEVSAFLQDVMGLALAPEAIATLQDRTEGWIAGLQLAALSLQGRTDVSEFLAAFTGSHRYILDYLSEEVLLQQSAAVEQFLLHTSILERLSGPLCDAVTEQEGSQAMLEALERANLFVVALDDERGWYRYHHLFAEGLRRLLQQRGPALVPLLHRRASAWYEQHDLPIEAVRHALAMPDAGLAARLIEPIALPVAFQGQISTVLGWLNALPEALVHTRPFLCVYYARLLMFTNQLEAAEAHVQEAERGVQEEIPAEQARTIMGWVLSTRAGIAGFSGNIPHAISLARRALELLPEAEIIPRAGAIMAASRAYEISGDVTPTTEQEVAAAAAWIRTSDNPFGAVSSICRLARLHVLQGRLHQAAATYEQVTQVVPRPEVLQTLFSSFYYYFGWGDLLREWNELEAAERHLAQGMALVKETLTMEPFAALLGYTTLARLQQARGNSREALATLDALLHLTEQRHFSTNLMSQVDAIRAGIELARGNPAAAIRWANSCGLSTNDDDLRYPREGEYLVLARVRIAQARDDPQSPFLQDVLHLLDRLLREAEPKARLGSVLEILIMRALTLEAQGNRAGALSTLERALLLAAPEGYTRLFVDEGAPVLALLRLAQARSSVPGYVATLLSVFGERHTLTLPPPSASSSALTEPLTGREREVLRLLLEGASNREIARRLVLSVNTVKRHVYNLCGKLGVQSRTQAIVRARTLNLL
ncbi:MAG TPA: LuxR C-terminal-related transcriptional regulator [Ktedonobacteraceae bacterium]